MATRRMMGGAKVVNYTSSLFMILNNNTLLPVLPGTKHTCNVSFVAKFIVIFSEGMK